MYASIINMAHALVQLAYMTKSNSFNNEMVLINNKNKYIKKCIPFIPLHYLKSGFLNYISRFLLDLTNLHHISPASTAYRHAGSTYNNVAGAYGLFLF